MKKFKAYLLLVPALAVIMASCSSENRIKAEISGGTCSYEKFEGTAVIKSITPAPATEYNCPYKPVQIVFEFTPSKLTDRQKYRFTDFSDNNAKMKINDGANPSLAWVKNNKIEKGKKYRCFRTELVNGTCTPVGFTFPDLNLFPETGCN